MKTDDAWRKGFERIGRFAAERHAPSTGGHGGQIDTELARVGRERCTPRGFARGGVWQKKLTL